MKLIFKRSVLIEVYRSVHRIIESNFYLTNRTLRHSHPTMLATLHKLATYIQKPETNPHEFRKGRAAKHEVMDAVNDGFAQMFEKTDLCAIPDNEVGVRDVFATRRDIGVN